MAKNLGKLTAAAAAGLAGAGAAVMLAKKATQAQKASGGEKLEDYRNTELGRQQKNRNQQHARSFSKNNGARHNFQK